MSRAMLLCGVREYELPGFKGRDAISHALPVEVFRCHHRVWRKPRSRSRLFLFRLRCRLPVLSRLLVHADKLSRQIDVLVGPRPEVIRVLVALGRARIKRIEETTH